MRFIKFSDLQATVRPQVYEHMQTAIKWVVFFNSMVTSLFCHLFPLQPCCFYLVEKVYPVLGPATKYLILPSDIIHPLTLVLFSTQHWQAHCSAPATWCSWCSSSSLPWSVLSALLEMSLGRLVWLAHSSLSASSMSGLCRSQ